MLDLSSLRKAIDSLLDSVKVFRNCGPDIPVDIIRDSVIQRFEYTYELSWKMIKRWLELNLGGSYVDGVSRRELFRLAAESHLIADPAKWFTFHDARNQTSHIYDRAIAETVFAQAVIFGQAAEELYQELQKRND